MAEKVVTGIEPVIRVLQTHALPLGYTTKKALNNAYDYKEKARLFQL